VRSVAARVVTALVAGAAVLCLGGLAYLRTFPPMATVLTGSMEPTIDTGDIVMMKRVGSGGPEIGDIVLVEVPLRFQQKFDYPSRVIHRVQRIEDGWVTTKGDNLGEPDPFRVRTSAIDQRVLVVVPGGAQVLDFLQSPFGLVWIGLGILLFVVMPAIDGQRDQVKLQRSTLLTMRRVSAELEVLRAGRQGTRPEPAGGEAVPDLRHMHEVVAELVDAVVDYGDHLRRNTEVVHSVAAASADQAAVVSELRQAVARLSATRHVARHELGQPTPEPRVVVPTDDAAVVLR
jgi:signal peptidase I